MPLQDAEGIQSIIGFVSIEAGRQATDSPQAQKGRHPRDDQQYEKLPRKGLEQTFEGPLGPYHDCGHYIIGKECVN
jgi:hypothetical protein